MSVAARPNKLGDKNPMFGKYGELNPNFGGKHNKKGKDNFRSKKVYQYNPKTGEFVREYFSLGETQREGDFDKRKVSKVALKERKSHKGYFFSYDILEPQEVINTISSIKVVNEYK
jgi:hypothetical protein